VELEKKAKIIKSAIIRMEEACLTISKSKYE